MINVGFDIEEVMETSEGFSIAVHPVGECTVAMPRTRKDFVKKAAVKNGIAYPYNNGLAEGSVNKIKLIKRIMYGRNSFALLKSKTLLNEYFYQNN